jgi:CheY-like chemotaxis protein
MARVLVVDDDQQVRTVLREILEIEGHEVLEARNGEEGTRLFRRDPVDLVTTNIVMPEKDGLELIRELSADFPGVRIIAISGCDPDDRKGYLSLAETYGASRTVRKPFSRDTIRAAVAELVKDNGEQTPTGT